MPELVIPSTIQTRLLWNFQGQLRMVNVLHFYSNTNQHVDQDIADTFRDLVSGAYLVGGGLRSKISALISLAGVGVRDIREPNLPEFTAAINTVGSVATDPLPLTNALVVTLRTAKAGKSYRGRVYLGGFTEAANGATGAINTDVRVAGNNFIADIQAAAKGTLNWDLAVASRVLEESNKVTSITVRDNMWDTQRRRRTPVQAL